MEEEAAEGGRDGGRVEDFVVPPPPLPAGEREGGGRDGDVEGSEARDEEGRSEREEVEGDVRVTANDLP